MQSRVLKCSVLMIFGFSTCVLAVLVVYGVKTQAVCSTVSLFIYTKKCASQGTCNLQTFH